MIPKTSSVLILISIVLTSKIRILILRVVVCPLYTIVVVLVITLAKLPLRVVIVVEALVHAVSTAVATSPASVMGTDRKSVV